MLVGAKKMNGFKNHGMEMTKKTIGVDWISNLPDSVLSHILSFVSIEEAIPTCILSKKWKYIWAYIPVLEFDFGKFCRDRMVLNGTRKERMTEMFEYEMKYVQFIKGIMLNRKAPHLDKFQLHWCIVNDYFYTPKLVTELIPLALKFLPRVLSVQVNLHNCENSDIDLIFSCASLEDVFLNCNYYLEKYPPNSINLPCLKKLKLKELNIGGDFLNKLFLGCPILEELSMSYCVLYFDRISSNNLKKLIINHCSQDWKLEKLEILTPGLLYLEIIECISPETISVRNMPSLVNAMIDFGMYEVQVVTDSKPNFFGCLSNVTSLDVTFVTCNIKEKLKNTTSNCPTFNNLKSLNIVWRTTYDFDWIAFFLHNSPNLQNITLLDQIFWPDETTNSGLQVEPKHDLSPREYLEMVRIVNLTSSGLEDEISCRMREIKSKTVDLLVKNFYAHVRTIGKIIIDN